MPHVTVVTERRVSREVHEVGTGYQVMGGWGVGGSKGQAQ